MNSGRRLLVTGATGYVGGRLFPALLERGEDVLCLARRPEAVAARPGLDMVGGDALDAPAVRRALDGVDIAYYLIHAMGAADGFEERDRVAASNSGNWQWVAGTGTDTRPNRRFSRARQGRVHDPHGEYVRRWLPELAPLSARDIHDPTPGQRLELGYVGPIAVGVPAR